MGVESGFRRKAEKWDEAKDIAGVIILEAWLKVPSSPSPDLSLIPKMSKLKKESNDVTTNHPPQLSADQHQSLTRPHSF